MAVKNILMLSIATLAYSFIGPMAKMTSLGSATLASGRAVFAAFVLGILLAVRKTSPVSGLGWRSLSLFALLGGLMSGNWFLYFAAIKVSTVAVAVLSLFSYPLMITILEPMFFKQRIARFNVVAGICILTGIAVIVGRFEWGAATTRGALLGVMSGLCFALYSIINRRAVQRHCVPVMMLYQFLTAAIFFSWPFIQSLGRFNLRTIVFFLIFGSLFTTSAQLIYVTALKRVSASVASIFISLQPFLTVILSAALIADIPSPRTIAGGLIICATVVAVTLRQMLTEKH